MKDKDMSWVVGKIGFCSNDVLGINEPGGHYVYIHSIDDNNICEVSTITSLDDGNGNIKYSRIKNIKLGRTYPVPKKKTNFNRWVGLNVSKIKGIDVRFIFSIGNNRIYRNIIDSYKLW